MATVLLLIIMIMMVDDTHSGQCPHSLGSLSFLFCYFWSLKEHVFRVLGWGNSSAHGNTFFLVSTYALGSLLAHPMNTMASGEVPPCALALRHASGHSQTRTFATEDVDDHGVKHTIESAGPNDPRH